jgi:hypothetical protein
MKAATRFFILMLGLLLWSPALTAQVAQQVYIPPDAAVHGLQAHNQHLAVIQTNCTSMDEAVMMRNELVRNGALVSLFTSPQFMLAWVPPEANAAVRGTRLTAATGSIDVVSVSYSSAEYRSQLGANQTMIALNEADEAILEYIDFIKRPLSPEDIERIRKAEEEMAAKAEQMPPMDCVHDLFIDEASPRELSGGIPAIIPGEQQTLRATTLRGYIVHSSFFIESKTGSGTWNWDNTVYNTYRNFYIAGMNYWSSFVSRYGKSITTHWRLYSPYNTNSQVTGEPTSIGEDVFIPEIVKKFYTPTSSDKPPTWEGFGAGVRYCYWYNNKIRAAFGADEAFCGFIAYKPSGSEAIWPHAAVLSWNSGDREGVYFAMDTRYWQALHNPFSTPLRNVVAHEIGHLWGAPDEYRNDNCAWSYRGIANVNCQASRPAYKQPGFTMHGWDGIMKTNYIGGNSLATPVHAGVITSAQSIRSRVFTSTPSNISLTFRNDDNIRNVTRSTPTAIPMDFDYRHTVEAPVTRTVGGTTYYFDYWEVRRKTGTPSTISYYANTLPNWSYTSTLSNPVEGVHAVYTSSPPDVFSENTTVTAHLAPGNATASPVPAIVLRWRSKYDMSRTETRIEYEASAGNWRELGGGATGHMPFGPFRVGINQWTGVLIHAVPGTAGTGANPIQSNRQYRFRIVGYFNTNRGTPSQIASITTRPATPADTVYCYDPSEPNSIGSPRVLTSSGPDMEEYRVRGALSITGVAGEFSWFIPKNDYYRVTAIDLSGSFWGTILELRLKVRPGSDFVPNFRAQRAGTTTHVNGFKSGDDWVLNINTDGEYLIKVEPSITQSISYDLVDRYGGHFAFGEYEIVVRRKIAYPTVMLPCRDCIKLLFVKPYPGEIILKPHPLSDLFRGGVSKNTPQMFQMYYQTPPGFIFEGFGGDFGTLKENPAQMNLGPNTLPGTYQVYPIIKAIDERMVELVVIQPEGPGGPFDERQTATVGSVLVAKATAPAGYVFVGWGGDTVTTTNPLNVTMWRSKKLIAHYRVKPCVPEPMTAWRHNLAFVNARNTQIVLEYAMQAGAGDGLEAGQVDLPPIPPPTAFDIRWINIAASQGSVTDWRAIKSSHIYQGRVQTGPTNPVQMTWMAPPATPNATFTLRIQGMTGSIDMRSQSSYTFADEGVYVFLIEVKELDCPEPSNENDIVVETKEIDTKDWPCVRLALKLSDRRSGDLRPFTNPYNLRFQETAGDGTNTPMIIESFEQLDSLLIVKFCSDPDKPGRDRDIEIVNDNEDPDQEKDTTRIRIPVPLPDGDEDPVRYVWRIPGEWQMISLPVDMAEAEPASVFADPNIILYQFNTDLGKYESTPLMTFGRGYWIKSDGVQTILTGINRYNYRWNNLSGIGEPYGFGWNMIGALSAPLAVSGIQATPATGLKAIFGWDPNLGYIVPTTVETGKGYWVRVDPNTTLSMTTTGVRGDATTSYSRTVGGLDIAGMLLLNVEGQGSRPLFISGNASSAEMVNTLTLPAAPPRGVFDVRTTEQTQYLFPGQNTVHVLAYGRVWISVPGPMHRVEIEVMDINGGVLGRLTGIPGERLFIDVDGGMELLLRVAVRPHSVDNALGSAYPNPFQVGSETWIPYTLAQDADVRLSIYDMLGRSVITLVSTTQTAGEKLVSWNGRDGQGDAVPAGVYVYRLETPTGIVTRTLSIVK